MSILCFRQKYIFKNHQAVLLISYSQKVKNRIHLTYLGVVMATNFDVIEIF